MGFAGRWFGVVAALLLGWATPAAAGPFSDWAAVVVAGDWHAHTGGPSEAFDNAVGRGRTECLQKVEDRTGIAAGIADAKVC